MQERFEYLANLNTMEDYRMNFERNLVAPISRYFGLKVGYVVKFDNLPEPGVKSTDRFATAGLQIASRCSRTRERRVAGEEGSSPATPR